MTENIAAILQRISRQAIRPRRGGVRPQALPWLCLLLLFLMPGSDALSQEQGQRLALIIGNASYHDGRPPLRSPVNDARAVAEQLRHMNFDVDLKENLGKDQMQLAVAGFVGKLKKGATGLFYFSGVGLQSVRQSYLLPVDAQIRTEEDVWRDGISVDVLLAEMQRMDANVKIIVVDAARANPYERRFRATSMGLAPIVAPVGTLALYSTGPGKLVKDGFGANSLFATELLKELRTPNRSAEDTFNHTRIALSRATKNEQVPLVSSSLLEEFSFAPSRSLVTEPQALRAPPPPPPPPPAAAEKEPPARVTALPQREPAQVKSEPGNAFRDCADCPALVVIPAGTFEMGSTRTEYDKPVHRVQMAKSFAIGRFEVTFKEWEACSADGGCKSRPDDRGWGKGDHPVINVSWLDAQEYVKWLSKKTGHTYRLPSEAEWEYAARGGSGAPFWWGSGAGSRQANCRECKTGQPERTLPVGSYKPNAFGLYDTAGNAAEWVEDCWNDDYKGAPSDGSAWTKGNCQLRVLRGGSFDSQASYVQSAARFRYDYDVPYSANGFRVLREMP
jgi:formylglycine-generating enzyme required for sulfatase activity